MEDDGPIFTRGSDKAATASPTESPYDRISRRLRQPHFERLNREGYYQAGCKLAATLLQPEFSIDAFPGIVFPMANCFRHYVELAIKSIIQSSSAITNVPSSKNVNKIHTLSKLWSEAKVQLDRALPPSSDHTAIAIVGQYVQELNTIDPEGQLLRYVADTSGQSTVDKLPALDLDAVDRFRKKMDELHTHFEGWDAYLGVLVESGE